MFRYAIKLYIISMPLMLFFGLMGGFEYSFNNFNNIQNNRHKLKISLIELKYDLLYDVKSDSNKFKLNLINNINEYLDKDNELHKNIMISSAISNSISGFIICGLYPLTFPYLIIYRHFF